MADLQMGVVESKFADIIWKNEPISSTELSKLSFDKLEWKKTTSFTVLKRLCDKGIFRNDKGIVTSVLSREHFYSMQSNKYVEETFDGSLPAFLNAFTAHKKLTANEIAQLRHMVDTYEGGL